MKTTENYRVLANVEITKLREYSQSYGSKETIIVPFVKEYEKEIVIINQFGDYIRSMKKGTKLLIGFKGTEISERAFKMRTKKATDERNFEREIAKIEQEIMYIANGFLRQDQERDFVKVLKANPELAEKIKTRIDTTPSKNWRNWVKLQAVKALDLKTFDELRLDPRGIKELTYSLYS